jgi:hypothetical protein
LVVVFALGAAGLAGGVRLARIASHLRAADALVDQASIALEQGRLEEALNDLDGAQRRLSAVNKQLYTSVELQLIGGIPVVRENIAAIRESVGIAMQVVNGGRLVLQAAKPLANDRGRLEVSLTGGALPVAAVLNAQRELAALSAALPSPFERPSSRLVVPPIRTLQTRVFNAALSRRARIDVLARSLQVAADMSGATGRRRYLIAVANTAEMRGSGGMILNYGILEGVKGDLGLPAFGRIDELELARPLPADDVTLPEDLLDRWFGFDVTKRWRNATVGADFSINGPLLEAMYKAKTGKAVDGVIQIDPQGLAAIIEGIGPVTVPGLGTVTKDNVVTFTLYGAYRSFPGIEERSDVLGDIAEATFRKLVDGDYASLRPLATALVRATEGRHILVHAASPRIEGQFKFFDADGSLPAPELVDAVDLTVQNVSSNKMDFFVETELSLKGTRPAGDIGKVTASVTVRNTAPPGETQPFYVFGPHGEGQEAGLYRGVVSLYLPAGATLTDVTGDPARDPPSMQIEGSRPVAGFTVDVPAGEERVVELHLELAPRPAGPYQLLAIPSPRVRPTRLSVALDLGNGRLAGTVRLVRSWRFFPGRPPQPVALGHLRAG